MFWHHVYRSVHLDRFGPFDVFFVVFVIYKYYGDRWSDHEAKGVVWRAIGVRERKSRLELAQQRDCTPCQHAHRAVHQLFQRHGFNTGARCAPQSAVPCFWSRRIMKIWSSMACTTARRSLSFSSRNGQLWKVHGVHPPNPAATIKREVGGKRNHSSPTRFSTIFPELFLQKPGHKLH